MSAERDASAAGTAASHERRWLAELLQAFEHALAHAAPDGTTASSLGALRDELRLAMTLSMRLQGDVDELQLVVIGPTQAGKSTLVNLLLDRDVAGVSALAGHTVHAQAFVTGEAASCERLQPAFDPLPCLPRTALSVERLEAWSCDRVQPGPEALCPPGATVWDTPDVDSIAALAYRDAVIRAAGVADVLLVTTSKDKYGDATVWDWLDRLLALGTPTLAIVNKVDAHSRDTVAAAFAQRLAERPDSSGAQASTAMRELVPVLLPWLQREAADAPLVFPPSARAALGDALDGAIVSAADRDARRRALSSWIDARRDAWLEPLRLELAARTRWRQAIDAAGERMLQGYAERYLGDADRYEAFDRTLVELLALLELPGLARALARTRQAVTWPARRLLGFGRDLGRDLGRELGRNPGRDRSKAVDRESDTLDALLDEALSALRAEVQTRAEQDPPRAWWRALERDLAAQRGALAARWHAETLALREAFQPRIESAAQTLYERLQTQPALLNTLRATRVGTDAAGIALAVKSGGLAPADLVLAPAMLSVTTLLTESALGRYLDGVKRDLKREQRELVRKRLIEGLFADRLAALPSDPEAPTLLGEHLPPALDTLLDRAA